MESSRQTLNRRRLNRAKRPALTAAATDNPHMARYFDGIAGHLYVFKTGEGGMMQGSFAVEAFGELPYLTASSGDQDSFVEVAVPEKVWCLVELLMLPKLCHAPIGAAGSIVILDVRVSCTEPRRCPAKDSEVQVKAKSGLLTSGSGVLGTELNVVVQPGQPEVSARVTFDVRRAGRK